MNKRLFDESRKRIWSWLRSVDRAVYKSTLAYMGKDHFMDDFTGYDIQRGSGIMTKAIIGILVLFNLTYSIEYSHRIIALGTDFAYLIPDYETDLYQNPEILGSKIIGLSYDGCESGPIKLILLSKGVGLYGRYWPEYNYSFWQHEGEQVWHSKTSLSFNFEDVWMLKVKNEVWNLYNDGFFAKYKDDDESHNLSLRRELEYFLKSQTAFGIGRFLNLILKYGSGFYAKSYDTSSENDLKFYFIPSGRISLVYRNSRQRSRFTSWFIELGGPISSAELDHLPYPIKGGSLENGLFLMWAAHTFISEVGWAKGIPIEDNSFFAIGLRDEFLFQRTGLLDTIETCNGVRNTLSFPMAVEFVVNRISLRFGTNPYYRFIKAKESNGSTFYEYKEHSLHYVYSFGLGWQVTEKFAIDLYSNYYLDHLGDWAVYLKYHL